MPTKFQLHCLNWKDGCGSEFCGSAFKRVFYRGAIPCDILCVGEAPGKSENAIGQPFVGPAGKLLQAIVERATVREHVKIESDSRPCVSPQGDGLTECAVCGTYEAGLDDPCPPYKIGFTNIVACIPRFIGEDKIEPDALQIELCKPRLEELISIAGPRLIVAVGSQARDALAQGYLHSTRIPKGTEVVHVVHPSFILRQTTAFQGLQIQNVECEIRDAVYKVFVKPLLPKPAPKPDPKPQTFMGRPVVQSKQPTPTGDIKLGMPRGLRRAKMPTPRPNSVTMDIPKEGFAIRDPLLDEYGDDIPF